MLNFGALPPEINSAKIYAGPGSGSLLAAAAGWNAIAAEMRSAATNYDSVITSLVSEGWLGPSSAKMATAIAPYLGVAEHHRRPGRTSRRSSQRGRGRLRGRVCRDGAPAGRRGQPHSAGEPGGEQHLRPKHRGDRGHRGPIRRDVGSRCLRDDQLHHRLARSERNDAVQRTAVRHHHRRNGPAEQRGSRRHQQRRGRRLRRPVSWTGLVCAQLEYVHHRTCRRHELSAAIPTRI